MTDAALLPPPTTSTTTYSLALVCLGNICRSPMAQVVLADKVAAAGLDHVRVTSCGTGDWHVGEQMDPRAASTLASSGYDPSRHRAQQLDQSWFDDHDAFLVMDTSNRDEVLQLAPSDADRAKVQMFRLHDPSADATSLDVPDPYYGGDDGFTEALAMIDRTTDVLLDRLPRAAGSGQA